MGQDIPGLAKRVYAGAPALVETEGRDYFVRALPPQLKMAVAASNPSTITECIDLVNKLCVMLDTCEHDTDFKKARRVDNDGPDPGPANRPGNENAGSSNFQNRGQNLRSPTLHTGLRPKHARG